MALTPEEKDRLEQRRKSSAMGAAATTGYRGPPQAETPKFAGVTKAQLYAFLE